MTVSMVGIRTQRNRGDEVNVPPEEFERMYLKGFAEPVDDDAKKLAGKIDSELAAARKKAEKEAEDKRKADGAALKKQQAEGEHQATNKEAEQRETTATAKKAS